MNKPERRSRPGHVWGEGILAHHFHGNYWASLAIVFDDADSARDAVATLGEPWKQSDRDPTCISCSAQSAELDRVTDMLVAFGAERDKIGSIRFSIDHGEWFGVLVPVRPKEQMELTI